MLSIYAIQIKGGGEGNINLGVLSNLLNNLLVNRRFKKDEDQTIARSNHCKTD